MGADIILKVETPNTIKKKVKAKIQGKEITRLPLPDGQRRTFVDRQLEDGVLSDYSLHRSALPVLH